MIAEILLASATAATLKGRRAKSAISHRGAFSLTFTRRKTDVAPQTSGERSVGLPIFDMPPSRCLPPLEWGFGISPSQAAKVTAGFESFGVRDKRFDESRLAPTPGIVISRRISSPRFTSPTIPRSSLLTWRVNAWI
ncbi:hypothetical protein [Bradyrhizobium sp. 146]|uniref:hypothetical protein n=1 Tax=Bradyrhizobium sp. 146 TaxID=2782622 RepID=UPI001FF8E187|nr:hypothetical protein [Bradyrhizobium sp. 146]